MTTDRRELIINFAREHRDIAELQFISDDPEGVQYRDIGEIGYVNWVYLVQSADKQHSVVLKYGETTMKVGGEEEISLNRQKREYMALHLLQEVLPGRGVAPHCYDPKYNIIAMEDLSGMSLLSAKILAGDFDVGLAQLLGRTLAQLHQRTARERVAPDVWQEWVTYFGNEEVRDEYFDFIKRVFQEEDRLNDITEAVRPTYRRCMEMVGEGRLLDQLHHYYHQMECFIHADCHCNAIFVKGSALKMFDFEFCLLSHSAMHLGFTAITCLIWAYMAAGSSQHAQEAIHKGRESFQHIVAAYLEERKDLQDGEARTRYIQAIAMFAGTTIFMFVNLKGSEKLLTLTNEDKIELMKIGINLMSHHKDITTVEALLTTISAPVQ